MNKLFLFCLLFIASSSFAGGVQSTLNGGGHIGSSGGNIGGIR